MKQILNNIAKRVIGFILILCAVLSIYNLGFNGHYHKLLNGTIVLHYHPYANTGNTSDSPFKNHTHSEVDFFQVMINNITISILPILVLAILSLILHKIIKYYVPDVIKSFTAFVHTCSSLRAPPQFA